MQNEKALKQAKTNVEKYFPVVGVLENLNETLAVLETRIPRYFNGLQDMYFNELLSKYNRIAVCLSLLSFLICHCINSTIKIERIDVCVRRESAAGLYFCILLLLFVCLFVCCRAAFQQK
jgi:hypothetical protein